VRMAEVARDVGILQRLKWREGCGCVEVRD
jgi:hypothetical protein